MPISRLGELATDGGRARRRGGSARGIVAAILMSALLKAGIVDVTTGLLLCAGASAIGVAVYVRATAVEPASTILVQDPAILPSSTPGPAGGR